MFTFYPSVPEILAEPDLSFPLSWWKQVPGGWQFDPPVAPSSSLWLTAEGELLGDNSSGF